MLKNISTDESLKQKIKIIYRTILFIIILVFIAFSSALVVDKGFRSYILYNIYPQYARESNFFKLSQNNQFVYILGTIHKQLNDDGKSLSHIESAIENINPSLLLVESRPGQLAKDNWADGPIEMLFASLTARALGIKSDGMDWHENDPSKFGATWSQRDDRMVQNIFKRIPGHPVVLILTGYSHVQKFIPRLQQVGYSIESFPHNEKQKLLNTSGKKLLFPPGMRYYVEKAIKRAKTNLTKTTDENSQSVNKKYIAIMEKCLEVIESIGEKRIS